MLNSKTFSITAILWGSRLLTYLSKVDHVSNWCARWSVWVIHWKSRLVTRKWDSKLNAKPTHHLLHRPISRRPWKVCEPWKAVAKSQTLWLQSEYEKRFPSCKTFRRVHLFLHTDMKGKRVNHPLPKWIPLTCRLSLDVITSSSVFYVTTRVGLSTWAKSVSGLAISRPYWDYLAW